LAHHAYRLETVLRAMRVPKAAATLPWWEPRLPAATMDLWRTVAAHARAAGAEADIFVHRLVSSQAIRTLENLRPMPLAQLATLGPRDFEEASAKCVGEWKYDLGYLVDQFNVEAIRYRQMIPSLSSQQAYLRVLGSHNSRPIYRFLVASSWAVGSRTQDPAAFASLAKELEPTAALAFHLDRDLWPVAVPNLIPEGFPARAAALMAEVTGRPV